MRISRAKVEPSPSHDNLPIAKLEPSPSHDSHDSFPIVAPALR